VSRRWAAIRLAPFSAFDGMHPSEFSNLVECLEKEKLSKKLLKLSLFAYFSLSTAVQIIVHCVNASDEKRRFMSLYCNCKPA
jgi:hypothetical protein